MPKNNNAKPSYSESNRQQAERDNNQNAPKPTETVLPEPDPKLRSELRKGVDTPTETKKVTSKE